MTLISNQPKEFQNGDRVITYKNTVGTVQETFTFPVLQETIILWNKGTKNITYTIGANTGTLGQSESVKVVGSFDTILLTSSQGTQAFEVWAEEAGTTGTTPEAVQQLGDQVSSLTSSLAESTTDLRGRGINAMSPPAPFAKAKGDGTDDSTVINTLLQNFDYVVLPSDKTFGLSNTIIIPDNKGLITLGKLSTLQLLVANIPAVEVGVGSKFGGAKILLATGNTTDLGCGIKIRLDATSTRAFIDRVEIVGTDRTGNGIYVTGSSGSVAFTQLNNMYFSGVKTAFKTNVTAPAYANGFIGNNWIVRSSVRAFYLIGSEGNNFTNVQWNTGSASIEPIYCESNFNEFHGFWWDLGVSTVPNQIATFAGTAQGNIIESSDSIASWVINDLTDTKLNFINTMKDDVHSVIKQASYLPNIWMSSTEYKKWGYWFDSKPYGGVQDNILAYADKINVVTNTGKALSSGTLGSAFDPFAGLSTGKPNWNLSTGEQAQVTIALNNPVTPTKRLDYLQVVFSSTLEAGSVTFEYSSDNGTTWNALKSITNNIYRFVVWQDNLTATSATSNPTNIRITISNPLNASKDVRVEAIIGRYLSVPGYTFMPRTLGKAYGNLDMNGNYIVVGSVASLPTASATYRGYLAMVQGNGTTTADATYQCLMSATGTYSWKQIIAG